VDSIPEQVLAQVVPERRYGRAVVRVLALLAVASAAIGGFWLTLRTPHSRTGPAARPDTGMPGDEPIVDVWRVRSEYVGSESCRACHPDQFETYLETPHSRALSEVVPDREPDDAMVDHPPSGRRYRIEHRDGKLIHRESLLSADSSEFDTGSFPLALRVGSGHFGRTYLCSLGGFLVESPVTWFEPRREWGMSPGYDTAVQQSFTRMIPENCLWCHAGQVETSAVSDFRLRLAENAIGCERCHGPGRAHVERQTAGATAAKNDDSIVNPRRLSRSLSEAICQQCHLQGEIHIVGRGVRAADFRPGLALENFRCEFRVHKPDAGMTVVGHVEQLHQSACYRRSQTLTCVTCHDPHEPLAAADRSAHYRSVCISCHEDNGCRLPLSVRTEKSGDDCVHCHMPHANTEVPHVAFTHHHIGVHPLKQEFAEARGSDPLVPLSDLAQLSDGNRQRALTLAWFQMFLRLGPELQSSPAGEEAGRRIAEMFRSLPWEAVDDHVEVARSEFQFALRDMRAAEQSAKAAIESDTIGSDEKARALVVLATLEFRLGRYEEARRRYSLLTRLRRNARDWYFLGLCENNCGRIDAALAALDQSRSIDPTSTGTYVALAAIHHARKDFAAEEQVKDAGLRVGRWALEQDHNPPAGRQP